MSPKLINGSIAPRGLDGGTELPLGARWRATRIEAEDTAGRKALVEEVRGQGWRWEVRWLGKIWIGQGLSKAAAIDAATRTMRGEGS
jgi:hypothetical protein